MDQDGAWGLTHIQENDGLCAWTPSSLFLLQQAASKRTPVKGFQRLRMFRSINGVFFSFLSSFCFSVNLLDKGK